MEKLDEEHDAFCWRGGLGYEDGYGDGYKIEEDFEDVLEDKPIKPNGEDDDTRTKANRYRHAAPPMDEYTYSLISSATRQSCHAMTSDFHSSSISIVRFSYHILSDLTLPVISSKNYLHNPCFHRSLLSHTFFSHAFPNIPIVSTFRRISLPSLDLACFLVRFYESSDTLLLFIKARFAPLGRHLQDI